MIKYFLPSPSRLMSANKSGNGILFFGQLGLWVGIIAIIFANIGIRLAQTANRPSTNTNVLGVQEMDGAEDWKKAQEQINSDYTYWKNVVDEHPTFRDGYIMLSLLSYRLDKKTEMQTYIQKILELDPNNALAKKLEMLTQ